MKEAFLKKRFQSNTQNLIDHCNNVIVQYQNQGLILTLRQLYYQLVQANIIPNNEEMYDRLGNAVGDGRMAGLIDWDALEDRVRVPWKMPDFEDVLELIQAAINTHRRPRWKGQENYVELWVEKDALSGVLLPLAQEFHITLMVNRGYSSVSAMYEASKRFLSAEGRGQEKVLLYLGDHDPSGLDMIRDVRDRLAGFGAQVDVRHIALTTEQVEEHNPPPNPAKVTDSRAAAYIKRYGDSSWEVDALPPDELQRLVRHSMDELVDQKKLAVILKQEEKDKREIREKFGLEE